MGNRAVISTENQDVGIYLHWNGGRDSVEAFLKYCQIQGYRSPDTDSYGYARLCQVIANYFDGGLSVGVSRYENADTNNYDNGVYLIKNWQIVGRKHFDGQEQNNYPLLDMLVEIDKKQPTNIQLGKAKLQEAIQ